MIPGFVRPLRAYAKTVVIANKVDLAVIFSPTPEYSANTKAFNGKENTIIK